MDAVGFRVDGGRRSVATSAFLDVTAGQLEVRPPVDRLGGSSALRPEECAGHGWSRGSPHASSGRLGGRRREQLTAAGLGEPTPFTLVVPCFHAPRAPACV